MQTNFKSVKTAYMFKIVQNFLNWFKIFNFYFRSQITKSCVTCSILVMHINSYVFIILNFLKLKIQNDKKSLIFRIFYIFLLNKYCYDKLYNTGLGKLCFYEAAFSGVPILFLYVPVLVYIRF